MSLRLPSITHVGLMATLLFATSCGEPCDESARKAAWMKYDTAVLVGTKEKNSKAVQEFADSYASLVDRSIAERSKELNDCHCPQDRPAMTEADITASQANLRRLETKFLISVCTSYRSSRRSVSSDGTPLYIVEGEKSDILHPMYIVLSQEAFDSLRVNVTLPMDPTLPDSIKQPRVVSTWKYIPAKDVLDRFGPFALEDAYRSMYNYNGPDFLADIEKFHNNKDNWSRCGLSNFGRNNVLLLCTRYDLNSSDVMDALTTARVFCD